MRGGMYKQLAKSALHSLGMIACLRRLSRSGLRILMYHRFDADSRGLRQQCEHIRRYYMPVSLQDVAAACHEGRPFPSNALAITVDDGYQDFLTCAQPVLQAFDLRATVFLVSDFIDGKLWLWWDTVAYLLEHTDRPSLDWSMPDGSSRHFGLRASDERHAAHTAICNALTDSGADERVRAIARIAGALEVDPPSRPPSQYAPLTWDEVRTLSGRGVEFGAHTRTHPNLSRVSDPARLRDEVLASKLRIESEIRKPVIHFCYPNGRREDFTADVVDVVRKSGFQTAVTTERGINFPGAPPFLLRRLGVGPNDPLRYFEELLAGARAA
jgi:peptidoglycan/xylan/chitin deacetylase (PgdA/CDA1 family)